MLEDKCTLLWGVSFCLVCEYSRCSARALLSVHGMFRLRVVNYCWVYVAVKITIRTYVKVYMVWISSLLYVAAYTIPVKLVITFH